jgi:hypothetical protein
LDPNLKAECGNRSAGRATHAGLESAAAGSEEERIEIEIATSTAVDDGCVVLITACGSDPYAPRMRQAERREAGVLEIVTGVWGASEIATCDLNGNLTDVCPPRASEPFAPTTPATCDP